jgi:NAD(P)-dependent dehydrogenase (short-subunit alcohol dehydrogenase family)
MAGYNASKAGLEQLTLSMAFELAHLGVRVNAVAPGSTMTPMMAYTLVQPIWDLYLRQMPMRRFATPEEQANAVLFLASDEASCITGVTLPVDGAECRGFWARPELEPPIPPLPGG